MKLLIVLKTNTAAEKNEGIALLKSVFDDQNEKSRKKYNELKNTKDLKITYLIKEIPGIYINQKNISDSQLICQHNAGFANCKTRNIYHYPYNSWWMAFLSG